MGQTQQYIGGKNDIKNLFLAEKIK